MAGIGVVVSVKEIQALDSLAIKTIKIPSLVLMENAGQAVCAEVLRLIRNKKNPFVCVLCGLGNNAGDGFVVARHLLHAGVKPRVYLIGKAKDLKSDAAANYQTLKKLKHPIQEVQGINRRLINDFKKADIVVDAIFGVGLNRAIEGPFKEIIEVLNSQHKYVISVDTPSGLDATTGRIYGICVKASLTVTFSFLKKGFFKKEGPCYTGQIKAVDIGIPKGLLKGIRKN